MIVAATILLSNRAWLPPAIVAAILVAVAVIWSARRSATERSVRFVCGALKVIGIAALLLCLLDPLWVRQRARPGANVFAVIADNSAGLQVKDAGETRSRGELLHEQLT